MIFNSDFQICSQFENVFRFSIVSDFKFIQILNFFKFLHFLQISNNSEKKNYFLDKTGNLSSTYERLFWGLFTERTYEHTNTHCLKPTIEMGRPM
jgi:hypothetical protein